MNAAPSVVCKGLTFLPVPDFDGPAFAFGAQASAYFDRHDLPDVPREYRDEANRLFFAGGAWPEFGSDVDAAKARTAVMSWLRSFAPAHEAKEATVAYALWVWSPQAAQARISIPLPEGE